MGAAAAFLARVFGPGTVIAAASGASLLPLLAAVATGVLIQVARAERSRRLLASRQTVSLSHSYAAMVVGHGIGDLVLAWWFAHGLRPRRGLALLRESGLLAHDRTLGVPAAFTGRLDAGAEAQHAAS